MVTVVNNPLLRAFSSVVVMAFVKGAVRCYQIKFCTAVQLNAIPQLRNQGRLLVSMSAEFSLR